MGNVKFISKMTFIQPIRINYSINPFKQTNQQTNRTNKFKWISSKLSSWTILDLQCILLSIGNILDSNMQLTQCILTKNWKYNTNISIYMYAVLAILLHHSHFSSCFYHKSVHIAFATSFQQAEFDFNQQFWYLKWLHFKLDWIMDKCTHCTIWFWTSLPLIKFERLPDTSISLP